MAALRLLDDDARTVLALHLDDVPTAAIAAYLDISEQRVWDLLKRARRTLRRHLPPPPTRPVGPAGADGTTGHEGRHWR
ncbi:sigma factor-like helix-turn-helix DNA-binding protein [Actinomadura nitritigenes]|uniref:sigma factor-like helix-turn-helix DNA-binding protein n=1 Tax=Actinomadura nitritigenes TaxID=134602 RepID=UPI003D8B3A28